MTGREGYWLPYSKVEVEGYWDGEWAVVNDRLVYFVISHRPVIKGVHDTCATYSGEG